MNKFRKIPKIDKIIASKEFETYNKKLISKIAKEYIENLRDKISNNLIDDFLFDDIINDINTQYKNLFKPSLCKLINATGVILHTNMGRSLISKKVLENISNVVCNYSNLEYDLQKGCRGERYEHVSLHIKTLLNVEDVLIVNNNASAVFLILNTFAKDKEVIVSRGELVEIGGSFRVPEVMSNSGAILKEIGATNKTHLKDYENAINENSSIIMKVHKSNYCIEGFSSEVEIKELSKLAKRNNILDYYDLGSGYIKELPYNLGATEPSVLDILKNNPSLLSFSGDKLLSSVQAGIIVGKKEYIDKLKQNQLLRMLRVDKITLSILEETFKAYLKEDYSLLPTLDMLFMDIKTLEQRALNIQNNIKQNISKIIQTKTVMGGGTLPNKTYPSIALHILGDCKKLEYYFRKNNIIGRIDNDRFLLDIRTIQTNDEHTLIEVIKGIK